jgi:hypothetical protein
MTPFRFLIADRITGRIRPELQPLAGRWLEKETHHGQQHLPTPTRIPAKPHDGPEEPDDIYGHDTCAVLWHGVGEWSVGSVEGIAWASVAAYRLPSTGPSFENVPGHRDAL